GRLWWFSSGASSCLPHPKRSIECVEESRIAERLEQALYGSICKYAGSQCFVSAGGYKDDRYFLSTSCQLPLKVRTRHPGHRDVEDQTSGLPDNIRCEERFG